MGGFSKGFLTLDYPERVARFHEVGGEGAAGPLVLLE